MLSYNIVYQIYAVIETYSTKVEQYALYQYH